MTLLPPDMSDRFVVCTHHASARRGLTVASVMAHLAAVGLVASLATRLPSTPPDAPAIPIFFSPPAAAPAAVQPASVQRLASASLAPSVMQRLATPLAPIARRFVPRAVEPSDRSARTPRAPAPQFTQEFSTSPITAPAGAVTRPAPAATPSPDDGAILLRFADGLQAVVRAAATIPSAAVRQHREGRAQVRFAYLDGRVQAVAVAQSSQSRLLDDAAVAAVQRAHYPPPPPQLRGRVVPLLVWIDFRVQMPTPG